MADGMGFIYSETAFRKGKNYMASSIRSVSPGMCIILPALSTSGERMKNLVELPVTQRKSFNFTPLVSTLLVFLGARSASHVSV